MISQSNNNSLKLSIKWISDQKKTEPVKPIRLLIDEASLKFDLDPQETEYLLRNVKLGISKNLSVDASMC